MYQPAYDINSMKAERLVYHDMLERDLQSLSARAVCSSCTRTHNAQAFSVLEFVTCLSICRCTGSTGSVWIYPHQVLDHARARATFTAADNGAIYPMCNGNHVTDHYVGLIPSGAVYLKLSLSEAIQIYFIDSISVSHTLQFSVLHITTCTTKTVSSISSLPTREPKHQSKDKDSSFARKSIRPLITPKAVLNEPDPLNHSIGAMPTPSAILIAQSPVLVQTHPPHLHIHIPTSSCS